VEVARITAVVTANTSGFLAGMAQVDAATNATAAKMSGLGAAATAATSKMATVGATLTRRLTLPIVAAGGAALLMSLKFEKSMAQIQGLVGLAEGDVKRLGETAKRLGPTYGRSAQEAAEALYFITSAGIDAKDSAGVLEASLKGAAIGLGDTATIADLATSAMNAYGSAVLPAAQATDVMVSSARLGKLEADELAGSMGRVLPVASAMGVSFDQVGAAFAALSLTGTNASEAATQVRSIMTSLLKPTKEARDQLSAMGLSAGGLRKQIREKGLLSTLQTLTTSFGDNEEAQAKVFGNVRALSGIMDLMGSNLPKTISIFDEMTRSVGATDSAYEVISQTAGFKLSKAFESAKVSLMEFGDAIAPAITAAVSIFGAIAGGIRDLPGPLKTAGGAIIGFLAVIGPLALIAGKTGGAIISLAKAFGILKVATTVAAPLAALGPASGIAATGMARTGAAAGGAAGGLGKFAALAPLALNPLGLLTMAAVGGAAGLLIFGKNTDVAAARQQNLATAAKDTLAAMSMVSTAFSAQATAVTSLRTASDGVTKSQQAATDANRAYVQAQAAGRGANETEIAYLQRINGLYLKKMQAEQNASAASTTAGASASSLAAAFEKTASASSKQIAGLEGTRKSLMAQTTGMNLVGASTQQKDKIAQQSLQTEAALGTAQRNRVRDLTASIAAGRAARAEVQRSNATDAEKVVATERINKSLQGLGKDLKAAKGIKVDPKINLAVDQPKKRLKELRDQMDGVGSKPFHIRMQAQGADKAKTDIEGIAKIKIPAKTAKVAAEGTDAAKGQIREVVSMLDRVTSKSATVTVTTVKKTTDAGGGFTGGWVTGYASGGMVSGPGGRDKVPAMLTAGEVVLTEKQQAMVNGGMNINSALRRTGGKVGVGGFAKGGKADVSGLSSAASTARSLIVAASVTVSMPDVLKAAEEAGTAFSEGMAKTIRAKTKALQAALKQAAALERQGENANPGAVEKVKARIKSLSSFINTQGKALQKFTTDLAPIRQRIADTFKADTLKEFDRATQSISDGIARAFSGFASGTVVNGVATVTQRVEGYFEKAEAHTAENLKRIEKNFQGTVTLMNGTQITVSFREFDRQMRIAQKALNAIYDAATPAESALKRLQDAMSAESLAEGAADAQRQLQDAKAKLTEAQKWGDPSAIAEAQRAVYEAEKSVRDAANQQTIADLTKQGEAERAAEEEKRSLAQEAFDTHWEDQRSALQEQLDGQLETERKAGADRLAVLQNDLANRQTALSDARELERRGLEEQLENWTRAFTQMKTRMTGNTNSILTKFRSFATGINRSGATLGKGFAEGLRAVFPGITKAVEEISQIVADHLKLNSPSKKGAMSDLNHWWDALSGTLTAGVDLKEIARAGDEVAEVMGAHSMLSGDATRAQMVAMGSSTSKVAVSLTVNDQTFAGMSRDQADRIAREIQAAIERQVTIGI